MNFFGQKIERPGLAFCIIVVVAAIFSNYGYTDGAALIFGGFAVLAIYKMISARS